MLEKLKSQLDHALEKLDDLDDYFEDRAEDFSEEMKTSWKATKSQLNHFGDQLQRAGRALEGETDHIALQAHLATMDAHDQWSTLKSGLESAAQNVKRDGRTQLGYSSRYCRQRPALATMGCRRRNLVRR